MANERQLEIVLRAQNRASRDIKAVGNDIQRLGGQLKTQGAAARGANLSMGNLAGGMALGTIAAQTISRALETANNFIKDSIETSNRYQAAFLGLSSVAEAFGHDQDRATEAAKALAKDGLMTVAEAAAGLKNLLAARFGLDEAIVLMERFKDSASFNRQAALSFGQAIVSATEGVKNGNSILVDNAGVTKNLSVILEEAGFSAQDLMNAAEDAGVRMAIFNGIVRETAAFSGDAGRMADTLAGAQSRANVVAQEAQQAFGDALAPAMMMVTEATIDFQEALRDLFLLNSGFKQFFLDLVLHARMLAAALQLPFRVLFSLPLAIEQRSLEPLKRAWDDTLEEMAQVSNEFVNASLRLHRGGGDKLVKEQVKAGDGMSAAQSKALKKMNEDLAKENDNFLRQMAKRAGAFKEHLEDLVMAHRDKARDIEREITKEVTDFEEGQQEIKDASEEKLGKLRAELAKEIALGDLSSQLKIAQIKQDISEEEKERDKKLAKEKRDHDKKLSELRTQLAEEKAILTRHAGDVAAVGDKAKEDDISRLKRKFAEERVEMDAEHQRRVVDIRNKASEQGRAFVSGFGNPGATVGAKLIEDMKNEMNQAKPDLEQTAKQSGSDVAASFGQGIKDFLGIRREKPFQESALGKLFSGDILSGLADLLRLVTPFGRAAGGPVEAGRPYKVGERGEELFVPNQSGRIVANHQLGSGGIQIGTVHVHNEADFMSVLRFAGMQMRHGGL